MAQYFKVDQGKGEDQFIKELDTEPTSKIENGTHPRAIVRWFQGNGLKAEPAENMTLDGLRKLVHSGHLIITPIQDYGDQDDFSKDDSGHYVIVCGFVPAPPGEQYGRVVIQDPSAANAEAGGRLPDFVPDSVQEFGKLMVREDVFNAVWHDQTALGQHLVRFGIAVGKSGGHEST